MAGVYTVKKKRKFSLLRKYRRDRVQVIYEEGLPNIWGNAQIFIHIQKSLHPISSIFFNMTKILFSFLTVYTECRLSVRLCCAPRERAPLSHRHIFTSWSSISWATQSQIMITLGTLYQRAPILHLGLILRKCGVSEWQCTY